MNNKTILLILIVFIISPSYGKERVSDIPTPERYSRVTYPEQSYSYYLQNLTLKDNNEITLWDGSKIGKGSWYNVLAVIDAPLLYNADLEQCADFTMRFWADYHNKRNSLSELKLFDYNGNIRPFSKSGKSFLQYLRWHMTHSNSYSIKMGAKKLSPDEKPIPGDMFVQNKDGGIGHVSLIIDEAENKLGEKVYLIGFSFMPAQEFHIERSSDEYGNIYGIEDWYTLEGYLKFISEYCWAFGKPILMRYE